MKLEMKMNRDFLEGKKVRVNRGNRSFFYTVSSVLELNDNFVIFLDRYNNEQYVRIIDILEVLS